MQTLKYTYYRNFIVELNPILIITVLIFFLNFLPYLWVKYFKVKRYKFFEIYSRQLKNTSFLPFNYLIVFHLEKGVCYEPNFEKKIRFELINSKNKRVANIFLPLKYLIFEPFFSLKLYSFYKHLKNILLFFNFFLFFGNKNEEIYFFVHRKQILEHVVSIRISSKIKFDLEVYLHGITIYSMNAGFAYYCSIEDYFKNSNKLETKFYFNKQNLNFKESSFFCELYDLFNPNYFTKSHPINGLSMTRMYAALSTSLENLLPKTLTQNIAPVNRQISLNLELLYYSQLGKKVLAEKNYFKKSFFNEFLINTSIENYETILFNIFNCYLLFLLLIIGLNLLISTPKPKFNEIFFLIFITSFTSLIITEFIAFFYIYFIKNKTLYNQIKNIRNKKKVNFVKLFFIANLIICDLSLFFWLPILTVILKQHMTLNPFLDYKLGYLAYLNNNQDQHYFNLYSEFKFLFFIYFLSLLIMFRFNTLVITFLRFIFFYFKSKKINYEDSIFKNRINSKSLFQIRRLRFSQRISKLKNSNLQQENFKNLDEAEKLMLQFFTKK